MRKGVTIKDIARKLNMSVSTVSKALHNDPTISTLTRERVHQLAGEWNYVPNEAARNFQLNRSFTIGLIIPDLLDQFFGLAINGVEKIAMEQQYNVIVSQSHEDAFHEEKIVDTMIRHRVDGVIVAISKHTQNMLPFQKLVNFGIPVVFLSRPPSDNSYCYVATNNEDGALKAMDYLVKKGHKRIAHLMGPASMAVCQLRLEGYKKRLARHKIPFDASLVKEVDLTQKSTCKAIDQLLRMKSPPTAVFTFKNYISLDAIDHLKRKYPALKPAIEFVGFGNLPLIQHLDQKPAASIEENSFDMGIEAARLLFKHIHAADEMLPLVKVEIPCKLVIHQ